jgi:thiol-disulfide isomerase/thioredoxin
LRAWPPLGSPSGGPAYGDCGGTQRPGRRAWLRAAVGASWLGGLAAVGGRAVATPAQPGQRVTWPEVMLLDGRRWGEAQARGKAVVVVFWSLHCPFCRRHNAHLDKLQRSLRGEPLEILTAIREPDADAARRHMAQHGYRFAATLDAPALAAALSPRRVSPLTVTVDRAGRLLQVIPGEMFEEDVLELIRLARD